MPTLLRTRPAPLQVVLAVVPAAALGALAGWLLGVNKTAYLIVSVVALIGAYFAGREHVGAGEGALRGLVGGAAFGGALLGVHELLNKAPKVELPHPAIILLAITTLVGVMFGAMGGVARKQREEEDEEERPDFSIKRIKSSEIIGFIGAAVLLISLLALPWFSSSCESKAQAIASQHGQNHCNPNSRIRLATGKSPQYGKFTGFRVYKYVRWPLILACLAPFILAWIIARGYQLEWRPGEVTMIVGMIAFALILLDGIILSTPGGNRDYNVDVSLEIGYYVGLVGAFLISWGGFRRQAEDIQVGPPGV